MMKWFGAKWNASRHYPEPLHDVIIEPFAGSACYALRHAHRIKRAVLWDTDVELSALWRWLIDDATEGSVLAIPIVHEAGVDILRLGLSRGQALLMKHWQRTNPQTPSWLTSPWGDKPGQWTASTRARVASQLHLIKSWEFRVPMWDEAATYFVDPPYAANYAYKGGPVDYIALSVQCRRANGCQVIVCEAVGKTGERPTWLPFRDFRNTVTSRRKATQSHHSRELIWCSQ